MELRPATGLSRPQLALLFTAAYEGYFVPFHVDEARLDHMVEAFDLDLGRSLVAYDGHTPVGLANLGLRGNRTWLGGVGVVTTHRRRGVGERLTRALIDQARAAGAREMVLEVIVENEPAIALYEKLGFLATRRLEVLTLAAAEGDTGENVEPGEARAQLAAARTEPEPWQRDDATVDNLAGVAALETGGVVAVYRMENERVNLLQATGANPALVAALRARGPILALNYPANGSVAAALKEAGATVAVTQNEMSVAL